MEQKDWRGETVILMSKSKTYLNKPRNSYREALFLYFSFVNKENDIGSYIFLKKKKNVYDFPSFNPPTGTRPQSSRVFGHEWLNTG